MGMKVHWCRLCVLYVSSAQSNQRSSTYPLYFHLCLDWLRHSVENSQITGRFPWAREATIGCDVTNCGSGESRADQLLLVRECVIDYVTFSTVVLFFSFYLSNYRRRLYTDLYHWERVLRVELRGTVSLGYPPSPPPRPHLFSPALACAEFMRAEVEFVCMYIDSVRWP